MLTQWKSWMSKTNLVTQLLSLTGKIMAKDRTIVETEHYELPLEFYLKCEHVAAKLEITVDYLLDEFYDDEAHGIVVPDYVME
jgi:hypothetical protein